MDILTEVTLLALGYVLFSVVVQRLLVPMVQMFEMQETIKVKTKELNDLIKNHATENQIAEKQKEVTTLLSTNMRVQLKPMLVILPIFYILFYYVFPMVFPTNPNVVFLSYTLSYKTYFILIALIAGILASLGTSLYYKIMKLRKTV